MLPQRGSPSPHQFWQPSNDFPIVRALQPILRGRRQPLEQLVDDRRRGLDDGGLDEHAMSSSCCERVIPKHRGAGSAKHDPVCPPHPPLDRVHGAPDPTRCSPAMTSQPAAANLTLDGIMLGKGAFEGVDFFNVIDDSERFGVLWSSLRAGSRGHLGSGQSIVQVVRNLDKEADLGAGPGEREIKSTTK